MFAATAGRFLLTRYISKAYSVSLCTTSELYHPPRHDSSVFSTMSDQAFADGKSPSDAQSIVSFSLRTNCIVSMPRPRLIYRASSFDVTRYLITCSLFVFVFVFCFFFTVSHGVNGERISARPDEFQLAAQGDARPSLVRRLNDETLYYLYIWLLVKFEHVFHSNDSLFTTGPECKTLRVPNASPR